MAKVSIMIHYQGCKCSEHDERPCMSRNPSGIVRGSSPSVIRQINGLMEAAIEGDEVRQCLIGESLDTGITERGDTFSQIPASHYIDVREGWLWKWSDPSLGRQFKLIDQPWDISPDMPSMRRQALVGDDMSKQGVRFVMKIEFYNMDLTNEFLWPDGDIPYQPTAEMVEEILRERGAPTPEFLKDCGFGEADEMSVEIV